MGPALALLPNQKVPNKTTINLQNVNKMIQIGRRRLCAFVVALPLRDCPGAKVYLRAGMMAERSDIARGPAAFGVAEYFNRLAPTYGDGEYYASRRAAVLRVLEPELAAARRILDLGCGNGRYLAEFARRGAVELLVGLDLSGEMLAEARQRVVPRARLVRGSATALPFADSVFDFIFASHVFPFVDDLGATVRAAAGRLRSGGRIAATVGRGPVHDYVRELIPEADWDAFSRAAFVRFGRRAQGGEAIARHQAAFSAAGLEIDELSARFSVGWKGIEEWIRLRWLVYTTETERARAEEVLTRMPAAVRNRSFEISEALLIGRKRS